MLTIFTQRIYILRTHTHVDDGNAFGNYIGFKFNCFNLSIALFMHLAFLLSVYCSNRGVFRNKGGRVKHSRSPSPPSRLRIGQELCQFPPSFFPDFAPPFPFFKIHFFTFAYKFWRRGGEGTAVPPLPWIRLCVVKRHIFPNKYWFKIHCFFQ